MKIAEKKKLSKIESVYTKSFILKSVSNETVKDFVRNYCLTLSASSLFENGIAFLSSLEKNQFYLFSRKTASLSYCEFNVDVFCFYISICLYHLIYQFSGSKKLITD